MLMCAVSRVGACPANSRSVIAARALFQSAWTLTVSLTALGITVGNPAQADNRANSFSTPISPCTLPCTRRMNFFFAEEASDLNKVQEERLVRVVGNPKGCDSYLSTEYLFSHPSKMICIVGHTDNVGQEADNQRLSEQRAKYITKRAIELGVPRERILTYGLGSQSPLARITGKREAENRRVIILECDRPDSSGQ